MTGVSVLKFPYNGHFGLEELSGGPNALEEGGLLGLLEELGCHVAWRGEARLSPEEEEAYGARNRLALASRHLASMVSEQLEEGNTPLGLLANCNGLMGMLAGHQRTKHGPRKVGLIWMDAHGDFNTPETSLSGMLGGMPVAISTGLCLHHIRRTSGLDPPISPSHVTMVGVRDTDPWEQYLLDTHNVSQITVDEVKRLSPAIDMEVDRLSRLTDIIYVHVDLDVLDPAEIPGAGLPVEGGPTAEELAQALEIIFEYPAVGGFGVASYPWRRDGDKVGLRSVYKLVEGVTKGLGKR